MSGMDKAYAFCEEAAKHGWTTKITEKNDDEVHVEATRSSERITIFWQGNSLIETPFHYYMGNQRSLHNKATATRQLSMKPSVGRVRTGSKRFDLNLSKDGELDEEIDLDSIRQELPFDPNEDTDNEILKQLRGSTIVIVNRISNRGEIIHIPRQLNMNLDHFFLEDSTDGKTYVSFLTAGGFRSVYLDSIIRMG